MATSISRLQFLRGDFSGKQKPLRPPWAPSETEFTEKCERCGECIKACPENILEKGSGGFPQVNFKLGECTFCGICADRCSNNTLQRIEGVPPWKISAYIEKNCLEKQGVICVICRENCELEAIEFSLSRVAVPKVNIEKCSGCGACYKACPVMAITIR